MLRPIYAVSLVALLAHAGSAQAQENYFAGKTINITIASSVGAAQDMYGRLVERHLRKHIPGNPTIIPVNLAGAGGLAAVRSLDIGRTDGTNIVTFSANLITSSIVNKDTVTGKFSRFSWVGSFGREPRICFVNASTGLKNWDDVIKRGHLNFGNAGTDTIVTYLKEQLGADIKLVSGYPGANEKRLAVERGELDGDCGTVPSLPLAWLTEKKIVPVLKLHDIPMKNVADDVPFIGTLVQSDPAKRQLLTFITAVTNLGRPFITSPGVPADRLAILQKAFADMTMDPEFIAEGEKLKVNVDAIPNADLIKTINDLYDTPEAIIDMARQSAN